jgi:hypothetical protein
VHTSGVTIVKLLRLAERSIDPVRIDLQMERTLLENLIPFSQVIERMNLMIVTNECGLMVEEIGEIEKSSNFGTRMHRVDKPHRRSNIVRRISTSSSVVI